MRINRVNVEEERVFVMCLDPRENPDVEIIRTDFARFLVEPIDGESIRGKDVVETLVQIGEHGCLRVRGKTGGDVATVAKVVREGFDPVGQRVGVTAGTHTVRARI